MYPTSGRYRHSGELYRKACEVIPAGVNSTARAPWSGWDPYPLFVEGGQRIAAARRRRQRIHRLPARPRPDDPRPPAAEGDGGGRRPHPEPRHRLRAAGRRRDGAGAEDDRRGAEPGAGAAVQHRDRGGALRRAPRARLHRPAEARAVRGHVSRLRRHRVLEQAPAAQHGRPRRGAGAGAARARPAAGASRTRSSSCRGTTSRRCARRSKRTARRSPPCSPSR